MEFDRRPRAGGGGSQSAIIAAESREIVELEEQLAKMNGIKDRVVTMLDSFDDRLKKMEDTIMPVYRSTQKLTRVADNLDRVLMLLNNVNVYLELPRQEEGVINKGPSADKIDEYLAAIDRIRRAAKYMSKSQIRSADATLMQLNVLMTKGLNNLENLFKQVLASYSNPFDPTPYIVSPIPTLPAHILSFLSTLATALLDADHDPSQLLVTYVGVRAPYLQKCLETPLARAEDRGSREGYVKGSGGIVVAGKAILRMTKAEHVLANSVFPTGSTLPSQALAQSLSPTTSVFLLTAVQGLIGRIRKSLARSEFIDSIVLFDLLETCAGVLREPERVGEAINDAGGAGSEIWEALGASAVTAAVFLRKFCADVVAVTDRGVPADGTVSELTSNTLSILRRLVEYRSTLELLLAVFPNPMKTTDPTLDPQTKIRVGSALCNPNLPQGGSQLFFTEIITALISNIETKARSYRKPNLQSVFLMNNYQFIHVALRGELAGMVSADAVMRCEKGLAKNREVYLDGWKPLLEHLMDVTYVQGGKVQGQLGKSQRDVIKEKFKSFNTDFESMLAASRALAVPDPDLRASLTKELRNLISPLYARFYDRYQTIEFSKNPEKYIRWDKVAVDRAVGGIWDGPV